MHHHQIILKHFNLEEGKISFSKLHQLQEKLTSLAEGVVLNLIEGYSKPGRGQKPKWLREILDFQLTALNAGSTILGVDAPGIKEIYPNKQFGIFEGEATEELLEESAFGLCGIAMEQALSEPDQSPLLDRYILHKIQSFNEVLDSEEASLSLISNGTSKARDVSITRSSLKQVAIAEQKIPDSVKTSLTGILDVMRHQKKQMEIITSSGQRVRVVPGNNVSIKKVSHYFGDRVQITGMAHFKTDRNLKHVEILDIQPAGESEKDIEEFTLPIFEDLDLKRLAKEQEYKGFDEKKFKQRIHDLNLEESPEELLALLKE
jgi:hypothetical protein